MARNYWQPHAGAIPHVATVTFGGTPAATDTVTVTINNSSLTVTVGTLDATTDVADAFAAAWSAQDRTTGIVQDESRNVGGGQLPEFVGISAESISNTVVLTSKRPGHPFVVSTAKTGTVTISSSTTQAATGPHHADNADNWSDGLPTSDDVLVLDAGSVSMLYGLDYLLTNTVDVDIVATGDFLGGIGLPWWNPAGYKEYLPRFLQLYDGAGARSLDVVPGQNGGQGSAAEALRFDLQSQTWDEIRVTGGMPSIGNSSFPRLQVHGGSVDLLSVDSGWVSIDPDDAEQTAGMTVDKILVGKSNDSSVDPWVSIGRLTAWNASDSPIDLIGGRLDLLNVVDPGTPEGTPITVTGGLLNILSDGDINAVTIKDGILNWVGLGTANGTIDVWPRGTLDLTGDGRAKSFNTVNAYHGSTFKLGVQAPTLTPVGCNLEDLNVSR